jgi:hypothetical protein
MTTEPTEVVDAEWRRYGQALLDSMSEVRAQAPEDLQPVLMETADYWLSLGLAIGISRPDAAARLLRVIEAEEPERVELASDAEDFLSRALG